MNKTFRIGGIHPPTNKTASRAIKILPLPMVAVVPLSQHIGTPSRPVVERGQLVKRGQLIAENASFVSAGLHAPISGTVSAVDAIVMPSGKPAQAITIKASTEEHTADTMAREAYWREIIPGVSNRDLSERLRRDEIRRIIADAGIVGLGGATFPAHLKLAVKPEHKPKILIINGCECEPYLMCDDALMCTYPGRIAEGVELMMKAADIEYAVIAIEDNKPEAAEALRSAIDTHHNIKLQILKTKYPQGGEKQLVETITGQRIASDELPLSVGTIVHNVATAFAVWQAVATGQPLIERVVTISGDIPAGQRLNYMAAIGTPMSELPFSLPDNAKIVVGGPMMGRAAVNLDAPIMKGTSGLTILKTVATHVQACIRCGACVDACPMGLEPYLLSVYGRRRMFDEARLASVADCIECGACSYSCPSFRPLLDYIRVAKQRSRK